MMAASATDVQRADEWSADTAMIRKCIKIFVFPVKRYMFFVQGVPGAFLGLMAAFGKRE
jgi:hypothetical protein